MTKRLTTLLLFVVIPLLLLLLPTNDSSLSVSLLLAHLSQTSHRTKSLDPAASERARPLRSSLDSADSHRPKDSPFQS